MLGYRLHHVKVRVASYYGHVGSCYSVGGIMLWCGSGHVMVRVASCYGVGCVML